MRNSKIPSANTAPPQWHNFTIGKEKESFVADLSMMLASGIPILEALGTIQGQLKSQRLVKIIGDIIENIGDGMRLGQAFSKSSLLPDYAVALIRVGEESGRLTENLQIIAAQEQKNRLLKQRIRSAMIYPLLVLSLTCIIGVSLAWFILPRLASVFMNLKLKLPLPTRALLSLAGFLSDWGYIAVPLFLASLAALIYFSFIFKPTKFLGQKFISHVPGLQGLILEIELSRMGYMLGTMLKAGIPVVEALGLIAQSGGFADYSKFYFRLQNSLEDGNSFQKSFQKIPRSARLVPPYIQQMIVSAEKSGRLQATLLLIAKDFEEKSEVTTKNLSVMLEPVLLVVVWLGVAAVALAVILPIYNLIGGLNNSQAGIFKNNQTAHVNPGSRAPAQTAMVKGATLAQSPARLVRINIKGSVYARRLPNSESAITGKLASGETVRVVGGYGAWLEIAMPSGGAAWVPEKYLENAE